MPTPIKPVKNNLFLLNKDQISLPPLPETFEELPGTTSQITIERIVSAGQTSPQTGWYQQARHEWVLLVQGQASIAFDDGSVCQLAAGDYLFIPKETKHKVVATTAPPPCIWLAIHYPDD